MLARTRLVTLLLAAGLLGSSAANAEDKGFYIGGSIGQSRTSFDANPTIALGFPFVSDSSSYGWKAFGGYQINKYFAIEGHYVNLGSYTVGAIVPTPTGSVNLYTDVNITGWGAALVGSIPVSNELSILVRGGETRLRESRGPCSFPCGGSVLASADNTWSPTFGLGLKYDFNANVSVRGEVERYTKFGGDGNTFAAHATYYSAGVAYKF